ncbi:MAG: hypothetical protein DMG89_25950 [Acidobacteria bacterium]|nr:MAG: hypothetical protein DMG89_25950 [Acidobacteriota bacterium]
MERLAQVVYQFGPFRLESSEHRLLRDGEPVSLPHKAFEVLLALVENPGRLVLKEDLLKRVWPGMFVEEANLAVAVSQLRKLLSDRQNGEHHYIETVRSIGYRFVALVQIVQPMPEAYPQTAPVQSIAAVTVLPAEDLPRKAPGLRRLWPVPLRLGIAVIILALLFGFNRGGGWRDRLLRRASAPQIESIAVLPLENLSHDPAQEYFADGMTEALITDLGKIRALRVISRTSVMRYKGTHKPLPEIARELNVDAIVEGSVQRFGDRARITANLLHARTDRHLWAESYERDLSDMLALQSQVAREIAREIRINLTPQERARLAGAPPTDPAAYQLCLNGRHHLETWTEPGIRVAVDYFKQAIQKNPSFALAYAGLAEAAVRAGKKVEEARPAALRALQMDDELSEAHAMMGLVRFRYDWDWEGAESEFRRAIELNPNSTVSHHYHAHNLLVMGRTEEALVEDKLWIELDPFSPAPYEHLGWDYVGLRRSDEAIRTLLKALQLDPNFHEAIYSLGLAYLQKGMLGEAIAQLGRAIDLSQHDPRDLAGLGHAYALSGRRDEAWKILKEVKKSSNPRDVLWVAEVYAALGDKDQAFEWLEKAYRDRNFTFEFLKYEPYWESLRSDPQFKDLLHRIGLPL